MSNKKKIKVKAPKEKKEEVDKTTLMVRDTLKSMGRTVPKGQEYMLVQIYKFFMMSILSTIIDIVLFIVLYKFVKISPLILNPITYLISVIYHFIMRYNLVINYKENKKKEIIIFIVFASIGLLLSEILIYYLVKISPILIKIFVCIIVFIIKKIYLNKISHK